jgi:ketopantoate reductase
VRIGIIGAGPVGMAIAIAIKRAGKAELRWYVRNEALRREIIDGGLKVTMQPMFDAESARRFKPEDPDTFAGDELLPARSAQEALDKLGYSKPDITVGFNEGELIGIADPFIESSPDITLSCTKADAVLPIRRALSQLMQTPVFFVANGFWLHPGIDLGVMYGGGYSEGAHLSLIPGGRLVLGRTKSPYSEFITSRPPDDNKGTLIYKHEELITVEEFIDSTDQDIIKPSLQHDIYPVMARKAAVNCLLNPLAALSGEPNGVLLLDEALPLVTKLADEIIEIMEKARIMPPLPNAFTAEDLLADFHELATRSGANRGSLQIDMVRGRVGEISYLNGLLLGIAQRFGIEMPVNATVTSLLQY